MGWSLGWDRNWNRDIGYGVTAWCDHPKCNNVIDRGLSYVCCGQEPYGGYGERGGGCGLFFCGDHQYGNGKCPKCRHGHGSKPYKPKPDHPEWIRWKLTDKSWQQWRDENPDEVRALRERCPESNATERSSS